MLPPHAPKIHPTTFTPTLNKGLQYSPPPRWSKQPPNAFTFPRNAFSQLTEDLSPLLHAGCSYLHCKPLQCVRYLKAHTDGEKTSGRLWCPHTESTTSSCTTSYRPDSISLAGKGSLKKQLQRLPVKLKDDGFLLANLPWHPLRFIHPSKRTEWQINAWQHKDLRSWRPRDVLSPKAWEPLKWDF